MGVSTNVDRPSLSAASSHPRRFRLPLVHIPLILLLLVALFPVLLLAMNSLKTDMEIKGSPLALPRGIHLENFPAAWEAAKYSQSFGNSLIIVLATIAGVCLLSGLCAYGLTRLRLPGSDAIATYYLLAVTIPAQLYLVPLFFVWVKLGFTDSIAGLIVVYLAIYQPFSIFLLRAFFLGMPEDIEDAARIDGCSEFQVFARVVVPLSAPAFLTVAVIVGTWSWNEFLFATTMLHKPELLTVALKYVVFTGMYDADFAQQSAAGMMVIIPIIVLFLALQRTFVQGMISGGLK
jgi:raffinose/stachyose/melibiose transport system permease protein